MIMELNNPFALIAVLLWIGCVVVTTIRESFLKLKPAGISVPFGVTDLMFKSLNVVEFGLSLIIIASFFMFGRHPFASSNLTFFIPVCLLMMQTSWLLPALNKRTDIYMRGVPLLSAQLRKIYFATEAVKVTSLLVFGLSFLV
jgi:hypothetical protein